MLQEVLERRLAKGIREKDLPDLLLVDGGLGQMNVALRVLDRLGAEDLDVLGIAKVKENGRKVRGKERIHSPHMSEPLLLEGNSEALYLLERIRDEAHRFAITYHKKLRSKRLGSSLLDEIPGVGPVLKRRLLAAFDSVEGLRKASVGELASVQGVSAGLAARMREFLELRS
jgi:excinuclease ABC subunit C